MPLRADIDQDEARALRNKGFTYKEIGQRFGVHLSTVWSLLHADELAGDPRMWHIDNAAELTTWLAGRKELHVHQQYERNGMNRWYLVERTTAKCQTHRCLRLPTSGGRN